MLVRNSPFLSWLWSSSRFSRMAVGTGMLTLAVIGLGCSSKTEPTALEKNELHASPTQEYCFDLTGATYVPDQLCADCHQEIYDSYQQVAMAKSFYDFDSKHLIESFDDNHFYHELSDNHYEMNVVDGSFELTRYKIRPDGSKAHSFKQNADYVVGSGNHVRTYLYRNEVGEMFQLPIVWYSQKKKWGMAPGYDRADHPDFSRPITRHCMFCHNAYPEFEAGTDSFGMPNRFPKKMPQGIGCQRCHGPGSKHVEISNSANLEKPSELKATRESIVNSGKLPTELQDDVCNQCHLQPMSQRTSFVRKFDQSDYGYQPGQPLGDYMLHFEPDRDNIAANHFEINHHPYRLQQSQCFIQSDGGIRCTHCHDPHAVTPKNSRVNFYRQKCFSCHTNQSCEDPQGTKAEADCIGCHMPARVTTDVVNVTMTDHKVSRFINTQALLEPLDEIDVPIEMPIREFNYDKSEEKQADKVYEYFARALDDDESVLAQFDQHLTGAPETNSPAKLQLTQKLLQSQEFERANDWLNKLQDSNLNSLSLFHTNAGVLAMGLGQLDVAIKELKQAVEIDPQDAAARYNLGIAFDKTGRRSVAIEHLKKSIEVRPNYVKPMLKLGSLFALANNFESAAKYFEDAIAIDVRNLEAFNKLSAVRRRQGHWQEAIALLKDAHQVDPGDQRTSQNLCLTLIEQGNVEHRDPDLANRVVKGIFSAEFDQIDLAILSALIEVEINQPRVALDTIAPLMEKGQRQAELGLIIAMAQKSLGSDDAAQANYQGAKAALKSSQYGRLGRVILEIANSKFAE